MKPLTPLLAAAICLAGGAVNMTLADGPADNVAAEVRRIPPEGIEVPAEQRAEISKKLDEVKKVIGELETSLKDKPELLRLLPDVEVYEKAVRYALGYQEFHKEGEIKVAMGQLDTALERAAQLKEGKAPWTRQTGAVVRGYRSKIDGSVQPYGLQIPESYDFDGAQPFRLDFWFHGRGETLSEVSFIDQRARGVAGKLEPEDTIVLHPYGRYSNANKFAGEVDLFEALEHAKQDYRIDPNRTVVRGFSMGGAACWQFAVHFAGQWAAAQPGAGFSETEDFLKTFQQETLQPTWYERKLWHLYDCTDWAINLFNCPTIAYSGENDRQKQAADMMEKALKAENLAMVHIIGPGMEHKMHPDSLVEIESRLKSIVDQGRQVVPKQVRFTTWTLRYNTMNWVRVDAMTEHWARARVNARLEAPNAVFVETEGVEAFTLEIPPGGCPLDAVREVLVDIDGDVVTGLPVMTDRSWVSHFRKVHAGDKVSWTRVSSPFAEEEGLVKKHGLQGPIDDAFMDSFLMVKPTGEALNDKVKKWAASEFDHAVTHWRQQFRGDARVKEDDAVTEEDIAAHNLILFGDPKSNSVLAKVAPDFPIQWTSKGIQVGETTYEVGNHALALIFPNPLNPEKYVVVNSGFTYREYDYLNNARQVPKLPDWAVIDISKPVTSQKPGDIVDAGFFGEKWHYKARKAE